MVTLQLLNVGKISFIFIPNPTSSAVFFLSCFGGPKRSPKFLQRSPKIWTCNYSRKYEYSLRSIVHVRKTANSWIKELFTKEVHLRYSSMFISDLWRIMISCYVWKRNKQKPTSTLCLIVQQTCLAAVLGRLFGRYLEHF